MRGLSMINIQCSPKFVIVMWIKRFCNDPNSTWAKVFNSFFNIYSDFDLLIRCHYDAKLLSKTCCIIESSWKIGVLLK